MAARRRGPPHWFDTRRETLQRFATLVDLPGMETRLADVTVPLPDGLCSPACPTCMLRYLDEVQRAVEEQVPSFEWPWWAAVLLVFGVPAEA